MDAEEELPGVSHLSDGMSLSFAQGIFIRKPCVSANNGIIPAKYTYLLPLAADNHLLDDLACW